ncbi:phosphoribosylamine--glycine ligase [bacterium endosymbiont of Bathymodiolus sp. 5 South]|jgi:phosphoribosylamine--glycine ligase|uniref:phosphoribosylamine--glycine ligase n=1 Tax=bacterium endosymbiont of Bathymodiolus sp. 5 South TaxID=1181670 RepID=UPI0010B0DC72|nr:phosphoribosylamine--glycine ligase [bacterium endosymbiont of Bathymodiolus sp. 5 South]CAC9449767.1 Phosphoribosylamine--glycine ligase (EC 6.3.4.13) [uncultured Gammaproteobacteria bacterium]CAC9648708.1 Phosphoribosylamine--glycine ligase (EC 6.3.4.13) [uncultured Gammaproteobacteria bacterium]SHN91196.1 Phosphoribosylamine--glycine ligase [bacterium endosymbiont of Bathymodiolus sp. 5 South]SSC08071.1 Phosphoribosylamine--glycine ligase [bacterium endosymbiont of Bathymodiolus sp. 5 Sou
MKVLVIGSGGREHALAWQCAKFDSVEEVFVAPGNAGTELEGKLTNVDIGVQDISALIDFAKRNDIGITIVGPEAPLVIGVVDAFQAQGLSVFGPTQAAAQLEGSKAFCKDFLDRNNIPTAFYGVFTEVELAVKYVKEKGVPIVIKADGLAAGKGVIIANTQQEATDAINDMLEGNRFGKAGSRVVVEEFLSGEEASFIVMVDGKNILPMATSQDHKARDNGDKGPNTGGMGAYSPAPIVTDEIFQDVMDSVIRPTVDGMAAEGNAYTGFLYAGLMIDSNGKSKVLEYNCRFGDPETQPIMMRLKSNLAQLCLLATQQKLGQAKIEWDDRSAMGVVLAANGYPDVYPSNEIIGLPADNESAKVFHAGTKMDGDNVVSNGGRVLCATAMGADTKDAQANAYALLKEINWPSAYYRTDIGFKAI